MATFIEQHGDQLAVPVLVDMTATSADLWLPVDPVPDVSFMQVGQEIVRLKQRTVGWVSTDHTTLTAAVDATVTTLPVESSAHYAGRPDYPQEVRVGGTNSPTEGTETLTVVGVPNATSLTVVRPAGLAHALGTKVWFPAKDKWTVVRGQAQTNAADHVRHDLASPLYRPQDFQKYADLGVSPKAVSIYVRHAGTGPSSEVAAAYVPAGSWLYRNLDGQLAGPGAATLSFVVPALTTLTFLADSPVKYFDALFVRSADATGVPLGSHVQWYTSGDIRLQAGLHSGFFNGEDGLTADFAVSDAGASVTLRTGGFYSLILNLSR